jgi:predicted SAM-dependent methyltransferase
MLNLDIGGGNNIPKDTKEEQWIGIDLASDDPRCIIRDLKRGLPFENNSFGMVRAHNVLEHIPQEDYIFVWNEIHRVLKPEGYFDISVPNWKHPASVQDPTHVRFFAPESFQYFCDDGSGKTAFNGLSESYGVKTLFKMVDNTFDANDITFNVVLKK